MKPETTVSTQIPTLELERARSIVFDSTIPSYILDTHFRYTDWNPAFEELIARPLGLRLGMHGSVLISYVENCEQVMDRTLKTFEAGSHPMTDQETIALKSEKYGLIRFRKVATQILDQSGRMVGWALSLNITGADNEAELWRDLTRRFEKEALWTALLSMFHRQFPGHLEGKLILRLLSSAASSHPRILELGSGTGLLSKQILSRGNGLKVIALEENRALQQRTRDAVASFVASTQIIRGGMNWCEEEAIGQVEAVVSLFGLSRIDDPSVLQDTAFRLFDSLRAGGELTLCALDPEHLSALSDELFCNSVIGGDVTLSDAFSEVVGALDRGEFVPPLALIRKSLLAAGFVEISSQKSVGNAVEFSRWKRPIA